MAGIYEPVSGTVRVEGRVTPLFDAMPGLDGEDTGYENIITSGMLIGMTRPRSKRRFQRSRNSASSANILPCWSGPIRPA